MLPPNRASRGHNLNLSPVRPRGRRSNDTSAVQGEFWQERGPIAPITKEPAVSDLVLTLAGPEAEQSSLADLEHPVTAYLNGLAPSSQRPQLAALEAIARRSTHVFTAETMPWQRLRRPQVLKIRSLLEENYLPATANRMLSALRGVLTDAPMSCQGALRSREAGRLGERRIT
jgi:hypothetical protein